MFLVVVWNVIIRAHPTRSPKSGTIDLSFT